MTASWPLGALVEALRELRGLDLLSAATFIATTGDLSRFESPRRLMACLGLVPSEHSSGDNQLTISNSGSGLQHWRVVMQHDLAHDFDRRKALTHQIVVEGLQLEGRALLCLNVRA